ncbi:zinc finger protein 135-like isoform X1 [Acanthochromis polyacanthus]|uniref:zinc finger protein 135-like isoform X1 n=1 Tax=Acanthochromis polyacanthus TaxID=80966 RepID=UPI00223401A1|nr:zinc finger protein 135-like isoform X1 [Acanthochromis polyacanthus]
MCAVQLLRVSVHERISAAAEGFLLQLEKGQEAAELPALRALLTERLTAAAEEIVGLLEATVADYEDRVERSEREICRQRRLLDAVLKPEVRLYRADVQQLLVNNEKEKMEKSGSEAETDGRRNQSKDRHESETQNGNRFCCSLCGKRFSKMTGLSYHLKIHSGEKSFSCSVCRKKFRKKGHLKYHALIHTGVKPFSCSVCNRTFRWPSQVKIHKCVRESPQRLHNKQKKTLSCSKCGEKFSDGSLLTAHRRIHQEKKKMLSCSVCGLQRQFHSQMKLHMRSHTGEKPYSCSSCSKKFTRKAMLTQHMAVHSKVKPFSCIDCGKRFCWNFQLRKHKCPAKSSAIDRLFKRGTYKKSKASVEPDDNDSDFWRKPRKHWSGFTYNRKKNERGVSDREYNMKKKPLSCPSDKTKVEHKNDSEDAPSALVSEKHCKFSEIEIQRVVKQEELEPTDAKEELEELELPGIKEEQEETDIAKFTLSSVSMKTEENEEKPQSSQLHQRDSMEEPKPVSNPDNEMSDPSETDVSDGDWGETRETRSDSNSTVVNVRRNGEKSFVCPVCGKIFGRKGNLETHLRTHTGERPFSCPLCNKTFTTKLIMKMHMSVHTGEKRFTCHTCGKKFNWHSQIKYHKCVQNKPVEPDLRLGTTFVKTDFREAQFGFSSDDDVGDIFPQSRRLQQKCQKHEDSGSHSDENQRSQKAPKEHNAQQSHLRHSTSEKPFSCSFCGKEFATGGCLTRHILIHTGEKLLRCFICEKTFSEEPMLISHECVGESSQHHQTKEKFPANKTFSCSVCAERFCTREDFNCHFRRHQRCSVCNTGFSDRDSLVQHMRSHTRQTQFICSVCGKDFAWRRHLTKHMENHVKKLYRCGVCDANFVSYFRFTKHQRAHQSSQLHHSSSAEHMETGEENFGGPNLEPHLQADTENKTAVSSDHSSDDSDSLKQNKEAKFFSEQDRNLLSFSEEKNLQLQSDNSVDSDFWKDDRTPSFSLDSEFFRQK